MTGFFNQTEELGGSLCVHPVGRCVLLDPGGARRRTKGRLRLAPSVQFKLSSSPCIHMVVSAGVGDVAIGVGEILRSELKQKGLPFRFAG